MNGAKFHSVKTSQAVDLSAQIPDVFGKADILEGFSFGHFL